MGTRACIARRDGDGWSGVYVHGDGGPEHTGRALVEMVRERGADATLEHAATAPQGWTHFPDEPSIYHTEPFVITPERDGGIEWLYLLTSDREIKVTGPKAGPIPRCESTRRWGPSTPVTQTPPRWRRFGGRFPRKRRRADCRARSGALGHRPRGLMMMATAIDTYLKETGQRRSAIM